MTIVTPFFCDCYLAKSFLTCLWASHYCVAYIFSKTQKILKAYHLAAAHLIDSSARPSAILWTETLPMVHFYQTALIIHPNIACPRAKVQYD